MGFSAVQSGLRHRGLIMHGIQASHVLEDHSLPAGVVPDLVKVSLATPYSLGRRRRTPEGSRSEPAEYLGQLPPVAGPSRVFGGALPGLLRRGGSCMNPVHGGLQLQYSAEAELIRASGKLATQSWERLSDFVSRLVRGQFQTRHEGLNPSVGTLSVVAIGGGDALGVVERRHGSLKLPGLGQCGAEAGVKPREVRVIARQQRGRANEEIHCREHVVAVMRRTTSRLEVAGGPSRKWARPGFGGPQFTQIPDGLFEVLAEDLRACGSRFPAHVLEPVGEAVVQFGAK